jgi:hypothetical protein
MATITRSWILGIVLALVGCLGLLIFLCQPSHGLPTYVQVRGNLSGSEAEGLFKTTRQVMRTAYWNAATSKLKQPDFKGAWLMLRYGRPVIVEIAKDPDGTLQAPATNSNTMMRYTIKARTGSLP